jgi:hypothetical protein
MMNQVIDEIQSVLNKVRERSAVYQRAIQGIRNAILLGTNNKEIVREIENILRVTKL